MNAPPTSAPVAADLAEIVECLNARLKAGEAVDLDEVVLDHPSHADELRRLFPTMKALAAMSRAADGGASDGGISLAEPLGDFRLVRELGRGGMGILYEAVQRSLNRRVALKVLPLAATMDPRQLQRFRHEAQAAAMLHHAHIVPVRPGHHTPGTSPGAPDAPGAADRTRDYAAPTAPVAALSTQRTGRDKAHFRRVAELVAQAADALEFAHSMGVVHRDIKPANLLLDAAGHLWVADFGLARLGDGTGLTVSGDLLGTLRYMSPEQALARNGMVDHHTDVYSLGATLYELLTLRPAVAGEGKHEVLRRIAFEEPTRPRKLDKAIPSELETITLKALAKNPAERYVTAGDLADDLRRWLDDKAIRAKPPSLAQRVRHWGRRHRTVAWSAAAAILVAVVTLAASAGYVVRDRAARRTEADRLVGQALAEADDLQRQGAYPLALAAVRRAEDGAAGEASADLRLKATRRRADLELVLRLEDVRLEGVPGEGNRIDFDLVARRYGEEFRAAGIAVEGVSAEDVAGRARGTSVAAELAVALDEWAVTLRQSRQGGDAWKHLLDVARRVDPDAWRCRLRDALEGGRVQPLVELAASEAVLRQPARTLALLGDALSQAREAGRAVELLREAWRLHPADFWINRHLGWVYLAVQPRIHGEALRYFTVAAALRPQSVYARLNVGAALMVEGRTDEGIPVYRDALRLRPDLVNVRVLLAGVLLDKGRADEAITELREAIRVRPQSASAHARLGEALQVKDRPDEAVAAYLEAARLEPNYGPAYLGLADVFGRGKKDTDAARTLLREAARVHPSIKSDETYTALLATLAGAERNAGPGANAAAEKPAAGRHAPELERLLTRVRRSHQAEDHIKAGRWDQAAAALAAARAEFGPGHPETVALAAQLAEAFDAAGQWEKGVAPAKDVVAARETQLGPDAPDTLAAIRRLSGLYRRAGRWADEAALLTDLLKRTTAKLGGDHSDAFAVRRDLAHVHVNAGRPAEAVPDLERMRAVEAATFGPDALPTAVTLNALATAYHFAGMLDAADRAARDLVALQRKHRPAAPETANALALLGMNLLAQGRSAEAEPPLREAARLYEKHPVPAWQRGRVTNLLGAAVAGVGRPDEAEPLLVGGYEAMAKDAAKIPAPWRKYLTAAGERVVHFYEATGRPEAARKWRETLPPAARPAGDG